MSLSVNISSLIRIFKKVFINSFFKSFKPTMEDILKYDNNLFSNDEKGVLNIYKIAILSMLKYARKKIYRIFILTLI